MHKLADYKRRTSTLISNLKFCLFLSSVKRFFFIMIANQLVYSLMITVVIATTVDGNCPEDKKTNPIVTTTNTSVNAAPGMNCCTVYPINKIHFEGGW